MALISFEDLAELDDEQLDDDITDNSEPMDDDDQDRLLAHWQAVGRTHQVSVPREMTAPIVEMTQRNQTTERQQVPFAVISKREKLGEVMFEERVYPAGKWACITKSEKMYEQSISLAFMKIMRFICKESSVGRYLGMTVPVVAEFQMAENGTNFLKDVVTAFYLPAEFQTNPPEPCDPEITISHREPMRVISRVFYGTTTEETIQWQIHLLWELLGETENVHRHMYMVATYENPGVPERRNEIWFIRKDA
ncbi:heme-binding protein soul4 [Clupea harengus]|uniref:Heme-binding protein soul4 n=1 Tax=Clupea harengus TaxID=7950 RepID=A0A6P8F4S6_CLUHA|nr:heme-binding protein soul4 [Clupea harengus]XP_031419893.1 heme-binding protein soul4 [Clupea harengus]XP_031419894.1 heme-binding protein soul4 [Clupea harengus]XP_031419895.1 heme-binding protein soul4 [Clupea harengus]